MTSKYNNIIVNKSDTKQNWIKISDYLFYLSYKNGRIYFVMDNISSKNILKSLKFDIKKKKFEFTYIGEWDTEKKIIKHSKKKFVIEFKDIHLYNKFVNNLLMIIIKNNIKKL